MAVNMVLNLILIWPLAHVGLALATTLSAFLNAGLLLRGLLREGVFQWQPGWGLWLLRLGSANLVMVALLLYLSPAVVQWFDWGLMDRAWQMSLLVLLGAGAYAAVLLLSGLRLRHLRA
jgi:putative peptidoglycan lipid II flippase